MVGRKQTVKIKFMKVILLGGSGLLGTHLRLINTEMICPSSTVADINDTYNIAEYIAKINPDIVINAAAIIDNRVIEKTPQKAIKTNILGAANVAMACIENNIRYVYISTDYIYRGDNGNYKETDPIYPFNFYAWTKLGGECSARGVANHLIIRTSFGSDKFSYKQAFIDKWSSKDYVDQIAPLIYEAALSPLTGVLNLGTERKTLHDYASRRNQDVMPVKLSETNFFTPYDTSLNLQKWMDYKADNPTAKPNTSCRACGSFDLTKYLDLGLMPLANNLEYTSLRAKEKERFPLQVMFCEKCALSQLSVVIDPAKMFSNYVYRSSVNGGYVKHARKMAQDLKQRFSLTSDSFMIDIAGNDGALLKEFKDEIGIHVLNVDPAENLAAIAEAHGIPTIADFWGIHLIGDKIEHNSIDLITATNVFAHVDGIADFLVAARAALKLHGILVIECPYIIDFIENFEFDTVYFEHLSYVSVTPINRICQILDMKLISVEKQAIHGGTIRMTIAHKESGHITGESVENFLTDESYNGFTQIDRYKKWSKEVHKVISNFGQQLLALKKEGYNISGIAGSAKGNTLLNAAGINTDVMDYIVDDTPEKIGKFSPGTGIPIISMQNLSKRPCDYLVILSWNFTEDLMKRAKDCGFKGKFIVGVPEWVIID